MTSNTPGRAKQNGVPKSCLTVTLYKIDIAMLLLVANLEIVSELDMQNLYVLV